MKKGYVPPEEQNGKGRISIILCCISSCCYLLLWTRRAASATRGTQAQRDDTYSPYESSYCCV